MDKIWFMLTLVLDIIPFIILLVILLRDRLPCSTLTMLAKLVLPMLLYNGIICVTYQNGMYGADIMVIFRILGSAVAYVLLCAVFRKYYLQFAYICLFTLPYSLAVLQLSAFCINYLDVEHLPKFMAITCLRFGFYVLLAYPYALLEKKFIVSNFDLDDIRVWRLYILCQAVLNSAMLVSIRTDYAQNGIELKAFILQIVMLLASMSVTLLLFYAFKLSRDVEIAKDKQLRNELLVELNAKQYSSIQDNIELMKQIRHDLRHHIRVIEQMIEAGEIENVRNYLKKYEANIPEGAKIKFCENLSLNALLEYYYTVAEEHNIETNYDVAELADCNILDIDLNILLGNALENAIEASETVEKEKRRIVLCAKKRAGSVFITVDNNFDGVIKNKHGLFLSQKRGYKEYGYGNVSMDAVVEKYHGTIKRESTGNRYLLSIVLNDK